MAQLPSIEVQQGEWKSLKDEGVIFTEGMTTCIGISVYSFAARRAILGHFNADSLRDGALGTMIHEANRSFSGAGDETQIWVGGGAILDPFTVRRHSPDTSLETVRLMNDETEHFRDTVLSSLDTLVAQGAVRDVSWLESAVLLDYALDLGTGTERSGTKPL